MILRYPRSGIVSGWKVKVRKSKCIFHTSPQHNYKLCILMFDVFHGTAPEYLTDLCSRCSDQRLRSSTRGNFVVQRTRTRLADSSFTVAGPAAWNSLPVHIRNIQSHSAFCRHLKTYLFADWFNFNIYFILRTYFNYVLILINYFN